MYCNSNTSGCGIFSHHSVTLEEDKTIDIATINVSIDHQKKRKGSRLMIVTVEKRRGNSLIYIKGFSFSFSFIHSL
jgi:hypothetical protein